MKNEIFEQINIKYLKKYKFFSQFSDKFLLKLSIIMKRMQIAPEEDI
jgi:hypothetical protein